MAAITWRKTGVYVLLALPMLGLAGIAVIARQHQQDSSPQSSEDRVAAAARKAREQRKDSPKPKKVYTNEDVSSGSAAGAAPTSTAPSTPPSAAGSPSAPADTTAAEGAKGPQTNATADTTPDTGKVNKNDEATWRKRFREVRGKLAEAEKEVDILQREANKAQTQYYSDPQKALSEQYNRKNINEHDTQIAAKKQEIAQLKQLLIDLEDELRKSGVDIGWARE